MANSKLNRGPSSQNRKQRRLLLESLENRQLMAVAVNYDGPSQSIFIVGSVEADHVEVGHQSRVDNTLIVTVKTPLGEDGYRFTQPVRTIQFTGNAGNDTFTNKSSVPSFAQGNDGHDKLTGGTANDTLVGNAGDDTLNGGSGNDSLWGGIGEDRLFGDGGDDILEGQEDRDLIRGGDGNDKIYGWTGNDALFGDEGADYLHGGDGIDELLGGTGNDSLWGGVGNDKIYGEAGDDHLEGQEGDDLIRGGIGNDKLYGWTGNDSLYGEDGDDFLSGYDGHDTLSGGYGNDSLYGNAGNDRLDGNQDRDQSIDYEGWNEFLNTTAHMQSDVANKEFVINVESGVIMDAPLGSKQTDDWSCGPNSAARLLQLNGKNVSYASLREEAASENVLAKHFGIGLSGTRLRDLINSQGVKVSTHSESTWEAMLGELAKGKPVIALVQVGTQKVSKAATTGVGAVIGGVLGGPMGSFLGGAVGSQSSVTYPLLHWRLVTGYDASTKTVHFVETDGKLYSMKAADFQKQWNWSPSNFNSGVEAALRLHGIKGRTFIA